MLSAALAWPKEPSDNGPKGFRLMRSRTLLGLLAALLAVWFRAPAAHAAEEDSKLACVLRPSVTGFDDKELAAFESAINAALKQQQILSTSPRERDMMVENESLQRCQEETCLDRIGRLLRVQAVVSYRITARDLSARRTVPTSSPEPSATDDQPRSWELALTYYNVAVGAIGGHKKTSCPSCTLEQASQRLAELLSQAVTDDAARSRGDLEIATTPSGATILLDGTEVGSTPYRRSAFAGHHQVLVRLGGFRSRQAAFDVEPQKAARLQFDLEPGRDMPKPVLQPSLPARQPRPAWRLALGGGLLGIGLAGVGGGAYGISIDGCCIDSANYPEQPVCIGAFFPGLAFTISGAAVALTGALLIAIPGPRTKRQPAASRSRAGYAIGIIALSRISRTPGLSPLVNSMPRSSSAR